MSDDGAPGADLLHLSQDSFRTAFEESPIGTVVTVVDRDGTRRIVLANEASARIYGRRLQDLVGLSADDLYGPEEAARVRGVARTIATGEAALWKDVRPFVRPDGTCVLLEIFVTRVELAGHDAPAILAHLVDVTEKVRAEQRHVRRTAAAAAQARMVTAVLAGQEPQDVALGTLDAVRAVFGADDVLVAVHFPAEDRLVVTMGSGPAAAALAERHAVLDVAALLEVDVDRDPDGGPVGRVPACDDCPLDLVAAARFQADGWTGWVVLGRAEPLEPEDRLTFGDLVRQVATAIELGRARADSDRLGRLEERQRLARDLHDTVLQDLIAMGVQLGLVRNQLDGPLEARVVEVMRELVETVRKLRSAVFQLRRPLEEDSVSDTVRALVATAARVLGHQPALTVAGDLESVPPALRADLAAALQEALSNVIRHAGATQTSVSVEVSGGRLSLVVADDGGGVGDDPPRGQGLANLAERAQAAGGWSDVRPGARGTVVTWTVPLPG